MPKRKQPSVEMEVNLDPPKLERQNAMMCDDIKALIAKGDSRMCQTCPSKLTIKDPPYARQCYECYKDTRTKRPCRVCSKPSIPVSEPAWKDVCGSCYTNAAMRPCGQCKQYVIRSTDPTWRTMCQQCYKDKNWNRTCEECKEKPIRDELPSYVTKCTSCYLKARRETHDACAICETEDMKGKWKRIEAPMCRECMVGQSLIMTMG